MVELDFAYSPCPNDTYAFGAAVHGWVDTEGLTLRPQLHDILALNQLAREQAPPVCKVSFFAYHYLQDRYALLDSGAALGRGVGPLLVARTPIAQPDLANARIAIPGRDTTAHLLLHYFAPDATQRSVYLFHEIMPAVANGEVDAGVIIHESRFTYADHGLVCLQDLGAFWEEKTGAPIPLGGIVARKDLGEEVIQKLERVLRRSVDFAHAHPEKVMPYAAQHAQEMAPEVMRQHIGLYVNDFTHSLGIEGQRAVATLLATAKALESLAA